MKISVIWWCVLFRLGKNFLPHTFLKLTFSLWKWLQLLYHFHISTLPPQWLMYFTLIRHSKINKLPREQFMFQYPNYLAVRVSLELFYIFKNRQKNSYSYFTSHISEDQKWISNIFWCKKKFNLFEDTIFFMTTII